jgi:lon-related putative ATP-dependent protease
MPGKLSPQQLRRVFDPSNLTCETTESLSPLKGIIGQERATRALEFGLGIESQGFNMYVAGPPGIGKMTAVQAYLQRVAKDREPGPDWCYVNNFEESYQPKVLQLPAGTGVELQRDMKNVVSHIRSELPRVFESDEYSVQREGILNALNTNREEILEKVRSNAAATNFTLQASPYGVVIVPVHEGQPLSEAQFQALSEDQQTELKEIRSRLETELSTAMKAVREFERISQNKLEEMDKQVVLYLVGGLVNDLFAKYAKSTDVIEFLQSVQNDIVANFDVFRPRATSPEPAVPQMAAMNQPAWLEEIPFRKYQVNVLVDQSRNQGAPVVVELNPSYPNLFGRIEKDTQFGSLYTDHTMIKPGSLHKANGGYLVLPSEDILRNLYTWDGLKRALHTNELEIEELGERLGYISTKSLKPQSIPLDVKVILVGRSMLYYMLHSQDQDFPELFKVKADFDIRMDLNEENILRFTSFLCTLCQNESLHHLESSAIGKVLEYASRLADDQEKLSVHFGAIADLVREGNYWASQSDSQYITAEHIQAALEQKIYRSNLIQEQIQEMIERDSILIATEGEIVGQVNGLAVLGLGGHSFGKPSRITASVSPGREGIVDIERQVDLGGAIHSKGVLILNGYLRNLFAQNRPLSLSARLVFEQSYSGVDGDSASSTELYALLSALSGVPIKQGIAVTGSVNQNGEVQVIGGANQKIEGFFDVCTVQGLTGTQGVMIPEGNIKNLMLREDVVEAVRDRKFHVWSVDSIETGIEILTGMSAGVRDSDGNFPESSIFGKVDRRFDQMAAILRGAGQGEKSVEYSKAPTQQEDLPPDPSIPDN